MNEFYWIAVSVVSVMSAARLTRLAVVDKFPPAQWLRKRYILWTDETARRRPWQLLAFCGYCASFWCTLLVIGTGYLSDFHEAWWVVNGILGASYLAALVMVYDAESGDDDDEDE